MKKVLTLLAAVMLLSSMSFAQSNARRMTAKDVAGISPVEIFKAHQNKAVATKVTATPSAPKNVTSFPWTEDFESGSAPAGFTFVDSDNDGNGWEVYDFGTTANGHNGSDYVITSASYINNVGALTPDNWMMLPAFDIPAGSDFELTWYEKGQDADYADEFYSVYINTTGNTVANFTATTAVLTSTATGDWVKKSVSLANYAGQTIYIAFRHHNVTDMFYLDIDDMRIGAAGAPEVSISGPAIALMNQPATFTATSNVNTLTWYVDGTQESATGLTLTYTFTTAGMHEVVAEATNAVGSASDTLNVNVVDCGGAIDNFPYTENFEAANPCWLFVSADPANDDNTGITTDAAHEGTSSFVLSSYNNATDYNQFLISPEFNLSAGTDYMVRFWYMGYRNSDAFRVKVSTTTADTAAFTTVLADMPTVNTTWTEVAYPLPAGTKYIAINYYGDYAYYLYIDALSVEEMGAPSVYLDGPVSVGTNMPATYTATASLADTLIWYVDGTDANNVGEVLTTSFTTVGNHTVVVEASNNYGSNFDTLDIDVFNCDGITIPYAPDFTSTLGCWSNRSDSTESGWYLSVDMFDEGQAVGQVLSMSAQSIFGLFMQEFPADNWLTSPMIEMPATGSYELAWSVMPYEPTYAGDHYGVYLIENGTTTLLFEETLSSSMTDFVDRAVAIPADGDFQVAFRHFNSVGGYVIILDNIQIRELSAPTVVLNGPATAEVNDPVTFTAVSGTATSYTWTVDQTPVSETGASLTYTFTTTGNHTVSVTGTNAAGTSNPATQNVNVITCDHIANFPYTQNFETEGVFDCWKFIDADGDGYNWNPNYLLGSDTPQGHNGSYGVAGSASWVNNPLTPDNWMIMPAIDLPAGSSLFLSWFAKGQDADYAEEHYSVYISTTGRSVNDFTNAVVTETTTGEWRGHNVSLADYAGQTIYVAFRHYNVTDMFYLDIDDITISDTQVSIDDVDNINVAVYPNPVSDVLNIRGEGIQQIELMDVNGRTVMTSGATSQLNLSGMAAGLYMVRVITNEGVHTQKIVKK